MASGSETKDDVAPPRSLSRRTMSRVPTMSDPNSAAGDDSADSELVPFSLAPIAPILRVANEVQKENPRVAFLCRFHAFEKAHGMDPMSSGRGVRQFKTYLLHKLEKEELEAERKLSNRDPKEIQLYYKYFYENNIKEGQYTKKPEEMAKIYQIATVLYDVLRTVVPYAKVDPETQKYAKEVQEKKEQHEHYNILPLYARQQQQEQQQQQHSTCHNQTPPSPPPANPAAQLAIDLTTSSPLKRPAAERAEGSNRSRRRRTHEVGKNDVPSPGPLDVFTDLATVHVPESDLDRLSRLPPAEADDMVARCLVRATYLHLTRARNLQQEVEAAFKKLEEDRASMLAQINAEKEELKMQGAENYLWIMALNFPDFDFSFFGADAVALAQEAKDFAADEARQKALLEQPEGNQLIAPQPPPEMVEPITQVPPQGNGSVGDDGEQPENPVDGGENILIANAGGDGHNDPPPA